VHAVTADGWFKENKVTLCLMQFADIAGEAHSRRVAGPVGPRYCCKVLLMSRRQERLGA
jgi:hypothetical protein